MSFSRASNETNNLHGAKLGKMTHFPELSAVQVVFGRSSGKCVFFPSLAPCKWCSVEARENETPEGKLFCSCSDSPHICTTAGPRQGASMVPMGCDLLQAPTSFPSVLFFPQVGKFSKIVELQMSITFLFPDRMAPPLHHEVISRGAIIGAQEGPFGPGFPEF